MESEGRCAVEARDHQAPEWVKGVEGKGEGAVLGGVKGLIWDVLMNEISKKEVVSCL